MKGKRPTLQDVAQLAGVSHQTVSRAINNKGEIDPETRRRVLDAARQIQYRPSRFARGLVRQDVTTIGLLVPDVVNPFFPELIAGVLDAARQRDWQVVISSSQSEPTREPELLRSLAAQVDALVCYLFQPEDVIADAVGGTPLVLMSRRSRDPAFSAVDIDTRTGIHAAIQHLYDRGHRRIGMIDCPRAADQSRRAAFVSAAAELDVPIAVVEAEQSVAGGRAGLQQLHETRPEVTGVFAFNDLVALGAHQQARRLGRTLPADLALIGFDGLDLDELLDPPLTTVHLDKRRMGELAVTQVQRLLDGEPPTTVVISGELVIRGSA